MISGIKIDLSDLIGKPYQADGRGPDNYDCWGLCLEVARRAGRPLPDINIPRSEDERSVFAVNFKDSCFDRLEGPEPWCQVAFRIWDDHDKERWHVGTVLENCLRFIHVAEKSFVCTPLLSHPLWGLFLEGYYRYAD